MNLEELLLEKRKRESRTLQIKELLNLIDFNNKDSRIRCGKVYEYVATQLIEPINTKLRREIKSILKEMKVLYVRTGNIRYFKHMDACKNYPWMKHKNESEIK